MKGMVFAGCSFTYGHGLEYYSPNNQFINKPKTIIIQQLIVNLLGQRQLIHHQ